MWLRLVPGAATDVAGAGTNPIIFPTHELFSPVVGQLSQLTGNSNKSGKDLLDYALAVLILSQHSTVFLQAGTNPIILPMHELFSPVVGQLSQLTGNSNKSGKNLLAAV